MSGSLTSTFLDSAGSLELIQGQSKEYELHVTQTDGDTESDFDLTAATIYLTVKCHLRELNNALQLVSTNVAEIEIDADPLTGKAKIYFSSSATKGLSPGVYVFDIVVVSGTDQHVVVGPSELRILRGVTVLP
jgi:methionine-rich copper-binding protein CopC